MLWRCGFSVKGKNICSSSALQTQLLSQSTPHKINTSSSRAANVLVQTNLVHKPEEYSYSTHTDTHTTTAVQLSDWSVYFFPSLLPCHYSWFSLGPFVLCIPEVCRIMYTEGYNVVYTHKYKHTHTIWKVTSCAQDRLYLKVSSSAAIFSHWVHCRGHTLILYCDAMQRSINKGRRERKKKKLYVK